jgi:hypothetical protein
MKGRFENVCEWAAGDGALTPIGVRRPDSEADELMDAWYRERQDNIEYRLYLDQARRLLRRLGEIDEVPAPLRRQVRLLLQGIRAFTEAEERRSIDEG